MTVDPTSISAPSTTPVDQAVTDREMHTCQQCNALCMQPATVLTRLCCVCRGDPERHVGASLL